MTQVLAPIPPARAAELAAAGRAVIVDIREADEFRQCAIEGAVSRPLSTLAGARLRAGPRQAIVFACKSGKRTAMNRERLAALVACDAYLLEGGLDAWIACGLPLA